MSMVGGGGGQKEGRRKGRDRVRQGREGRRTQKRCVDPSIANETSLRARTPFARKGRGSSREKRRFLVWIQPVLCARDGDAERRAEREGDGQGRGDDPETRLGRNSRDQHEESKLSRQKPEKVCD